MIGEVFDILKIIIKSNLTINNCIVSTIKTLLDINLNF